VKLLRGSFVVVVVVVVVIVLFKNEPIELKNVIQFEKNSRLRACAYKTSMFKSRLISPRSPILKRAWE